MTPTDPQRLLRGPRLGMPSITLGGSLPLLTTTSLQQKSLFISVIGFLVATLTALRGFYKWDSSWVLLRGTEITLARLYLNWKAAQDAKSDEKAQRAAAAALLNQLLDVRQDESKAFFKDLPLARVPEGKPEAPP